MAIGLNDLRTPRSDEDKSESNRENKAIYGARPNQHRDGSAEDKKYERRKRNKGDDDPVTPLLNFGMKAFEERDRSVCRADDRRDGRRPHNDAEEFVPDNACRILKN